MKLNIVTVGLWLAVATCASPTSVSVFYRSGKYSVEFGRVSTEAAAWATLNNTSNETGWAKLKVHARGDHAHYAAGLAEGSLTCELVSAAAANNDDPDQLGAVLNYTQETEAWTR